MSVTQDYKTVTFDQRELSEVRIALAYHAACLEGRIARAPGGTLERDILTRQLEATLSAGALVARKPK